jgi:hypothetical protein
LIYGGRYWDRTSGPRRVNARSSTRALNFQFDSCVVPESVFSRPSVNIGISLQVGVTVGVTIRFRVWEHRRINQMLSN